MMKFCAVILTLFLLAQNAFGGKFDYGVFENFDVMAKAFKEDVAIRSHIQSLKQSLKDKLELLENIRRKEDQVTFRSLGKLKSFNSDIAKINVSCSELGNNLDFEGKASLDGAINGLLMIINTYKISAEELLSGKINAGRFRVPSDNFQARNGLSIHDFLDVSGAALKLGWLDTAIEFLKLAYKIQKDGYVPSQKWEQVHLDQMPKLKKYLIKAHNEFLSKRKSISGQGYKLLPYMLDDNLKKAKKQPKFIKKLEEIHLEKMRTDVEYEKAYMQRGDPKDDQFRKVCRSEVIGHSVLMQRGMVKCHWLHHQDPFLRLAPFKVEYLLIDPFRMIFHDIFAEEELEWMIEYSTPRLSRTRHKDSKMDDIINRNNGKNSKMIHKTVQCWIKDDNYTNEAIWTQNEPWTLEGFEGNGDPDEMKIDFPVMRKLSYKIEQATQMVLTKRWSASSYQITNYGLSGLCETHIDPVGHIGGTPLTWMTRELVKQGDMIATFMGWLKDVPAGGETAFDKPGVKQTIQPRRGSAAFWINLGRDGFRDELTSHGGCPVAVGSKWILNKWIYYYDQFQKWKCGQTAKEIFRPYTGIY